MGSGKLGPQMADISIDKRKGDHFEHWTIWGVGWVVSGDFLDINLLQMVKHSFSFF